MSDLNASLAAQRNWLERLGQRIPGFRGYYDRETRREADKLLRDFGVRRLERIISDLHEATQRAPLEQKDDIEGVVNDAEKLRNELRHCDRGYSGFFDEVKWDRADLLDALYQKDGALVDRIEALAAEVAEGGFELEALRRELRELSRTHAERRDVILRASEGR